MPDQRGHPSGTASWSSMPPAWRAGAVITAGLTCGIATGLLHAVVLFVRLHVVHELVWFSREFVWMAPITYTSLFLPAALLLGACAALIPHRAVFTVAIVCYVTAGVFGLLLPYPEIARIAALVFALGVAVQAARVAGPRAVTGAAWWRRALAAGALLVLAAATLAPPLRRAREARALASLAPAANDAPNVLFIILDTVRAASMGLYGGGDDDTPALERWAQDGVTFDWAFSAAPWTLPSHASMFTGRRPLQLSTDWKRPLDGRDSTLAEMLRARGYATAGFVANMQYTSYDSGLDRGFIRYEDYRVSPLQLMWSSSYTQTALFQAIRRARSPGDVISAVLHPNLSIDMKHHFDAKHGAEVDGAFLRWQQDIGGRPFFAFLNFMDAHQPYFAPPEFRRFAPGRNSHGDYAAAIAYLDAQVDSILTTLAGRGVLDRTIVVVAGDHGELFGATHKLTGHAHDLYVNVLRVPLLIRYPARVPRGQRVERVASLRDLAATVLDLAGARGASVPGESLARLWSGDVTPGSPVFASVTFAPNVEPDLPTAKGPLRAALDDSLHYITNRDGKEELYEYRTDSLEASNLAGDPARAAVLGRLRAAVRSLAPGGRN